MNLRLTMDNQPDLRAWAAPRMGVGELASDMVLIGIVGPGGIVAAVGFNAFYDASASIHIASDGGRRWAARRVLNAIFGYAFDYRGLDRLNLIVPVARKDAQILAIKCGGVFEGYHRRAGPNGEDSVSFGILAEECPYFVPRVKKEPGNG